MAFKMRSGNGPLKFKSMGSSPMKLWPWGRKAKIRRMQSKLDKHDENIEKERIAQQEIDDLELDRKFTESLSQMSNEELEAARTNTDLLPSPKTDVDIAEEQSIADIKAKYAERKASREKIV